MVSDRLGPKLAMSESEAHIEELTDEAPVGLVEITGFIKWFDASKGYGFVVPDNGMPDVLLHVTCLRRDGFQTAYEGARVVGRGAGAAQGAARLPRRLAWTNRRRSTRRRCRRRAPT